MSVEQRQELKQIKKSIDKYCDFVEIEPRAHFIVTIQLTTIFKNYGRIEYNNTLYEFGLDNIGYKVIM